jgi:hypothetical protein
MHEKIFFLDCRVMNDGDHSSRVEERLRQTPDRAENFQPSSCMRRRTSQGTVTLRMLQQEATEVRRTPFTVRASSRM